MESILKWLFESELNIPMEQEEAYQYAEAGEKVIDTCAPKGLFLAREGKAWVAVDNPPDALGRRSSDPGVRQSVG